MNIDQDNPNHRWLMALVAVVLVTFAFWGVWMAVGAIIGGTGWVFNKLGNSLLVAMQAMWAVHDIVAWIGVACGAVIGVLLGLNPRLDRVWNRVLARRGADGAS